MIKLGNVHQVDLPIRVGLKQYADLVAERTKNQIQVFPASQLGTEQEPSEELFAGSPTGAKTKWLE